MLMSIAVTAMAQKWSLARDDLMAANLWSSQIRGFRWVLRSSGASPWWDESRDNFGDEFRSFIDAQIREEAATD